MSETTPAPQPTGQPAQPLVVNIQYVKDLSFEVPGAPQIYTQLRSQPQVSINLDVQARRIQEGQNVFEVALMIRAEAHDGRPKPTARQLRRPDGICRRTDLCRRLHAERPARKRDRARPAGGMPAHPVPLRPQHPGRRNPRRRLPAGAAAAYRLRRAMAVPPQSGRRWPRRCVTPDPSAEQATPTQRGSRASLTTLAQTPGPKHPRRAALRHRAPQQ